MARASDPVFVCDLDSTILRINSFPFWVLFLIGGRLPRLGYRDRAVLSLRVQGSLARRKLGLLDHHALLRRIQTAWHDAGAREADAAPVIGLLRNLRRPALDSLLGNITAERVDAILATAAAGEYAFALGRHLGFRHVVATPCRLPEQERINAGAWKLARVRERLRLLGWDARPIVVLTDHLDDLPLMRHGDVVGWFGAPASVTRVSVLAGGVECVACRGLDRPAMAAALSSMFSRASASTSA